MAYLDVSTVVFAVLFQRFVYQKSSYSLSGRASAPSKNGFFSGVFNLSYGLIVLGLYLHMGNPFFQGEGMWEWALRYSLGVICFFGGGLLLKEGRTSLGPDYSDCKDSYLPRKIRTKGIYSYIRHPIYSGNLLMTLGNVFVLPGYPSFILLGVLTASYHLAIRREEKDLRNHFEVYESYVKSTGAFMPVLTIKKYVEVDASFVREKNESQIEPVESNTKLAA